MQSEEKASRSSLNKRASLGYGSQKSMRTLGRVGMEDLVRIRLLLRRKRRKTQMHCRRWERQGRISYRRLVDQHEEKWNNLLDSSNNDHYHYYIHNRSPSSKYYLFIHNKPLCSKIVLTTHPSLLGKAAACDTVIPTPPTRAHCYLCCKQKPTIALIPQEPKADSWP
jgi:hypothetical protein